MNAQELHAKLSASGLPGIGALDTSAKDPFVLVEPAALVGVLLITYWPWLTTGVLALFGRS